ncbi:MULTISPECIES: TIGR02281 family clan AA aspartic protease [unclassified Rhizobium]|uniref:TIGR02281 family clan AA aspartic protease n=1 Tax=unclassified Rhizobium TaxID=2613769 RepID=UPI000EA8F2E7|nr:MULTISPECIES: TIGR02281 family clan AA aspartic protease [unclassified Rhizobium]AYG64835.1 TIGR02281 family clan AA aspartic protease [Rhizobium sp. CCGE531]AYG71318.1 TIGR02281 family clan AA aspartic protease [Rhizobium sp. CCGE532]
MLVRVLVFAGVIAVAATQVPMLVNSYNERAEKPAPVEAASLAPPKAEAPVSYGSVQLRANAGGHYEGDFTINGRSVHGMIDTGATYVAINESTARSLGFSGVDLDYRYPIQTANGTSKVAHVKLDRLEIGTIRVRDVDAVVAKDSALSTTLIGMSFMKKLNSFGVQNGNLLLKQ